MMGDGSMSPRPGRHQIPKCPKTLSSLFRPVVGLSHHNCNLRIRALMFEVNVDVFGFEFGWCFCWKRAFACRATHFA